MLQSLTFERIKELLIIIPAAHVFLCFCYLFFYYSSFGHGIWLFSSPTDVFSVSFSDVAPGYLALFVGMVAGHFIFSSPAKQSGEATTAPSYFRVFFWILVSGLGFGVVLAVIVWIKSGFLSYELLVGPVAISVGIAWGIWGRKFTTEPIILNVGLASSIAICSMAFRGLSDGQLDRAALIVDISADKPTCGNQTVLRALSADYLAASPDNSRVIIDSDCRIKFTLLPADKFMPRPKKAPIDIAFGNW